MTLYAHSGSKEDKSDWQTLEEHLREVGRMAGDFAKPFNASPWAEAAGVLHDAGKSYPEFQLRLEGKHPAFDHSSPGARLARMAYPKDRANEGNPLVPVIAGHHTGLQDGSAIADRIKSDATEHPQVQLRRDFAPFESLLPAEDVTTRTTLLRTKCPNGCDAKEFATFNMYVLERLLFSSLVDADWLDTERVMSPDDYRMRLAAKSDQASVGELLERLVDYRQKKFAGVKDTPVNRAREEMLDRACKMADAPTGIFSLNMPTGGGKTLTSLEFALRHALRNHQARVVYAIPFMSIVEQNAAVFKDAIGSENVLEHFSSYDYGFSKAVNEADDDASESGLRERMLVQNWDAPVVVTTNVQLFESLFSKKTTRSRKVHNIANSVIVLDEAQSLPDGLLKPTLAMLESLTRIANVSVVICTATQPGLERCMPFKSQVKPIIDEETRHSELFSGRTDFDISHISEEAGGEGPIDLDELVDEALSQKQSLCIVSSRRAAVQVFDAIKDRAEEPDAVFHLSALMIPVHRTKVLEEVRNRLKTGRPCHLISTQLIEAGVDVDFPLVLRELTGIDSVLQAAGRCNREGALSGRGRVVVFECRDFESQQKPSQSWLTKVKALGKETLKFAAQRQWEPFGDNAVSYYFDRRHQTGELDGAAGKPIYGCITNSDKWSLYCSDGSYPFETISDRYRFIDNADVGIFVPWGEGGERLLNRIQSKDPWGPDLFPQVQRHSINVAPWMYQKYQSAGLIRRIDGFPVPVLETRDGMNEGCEDERGRLDPEAGGIETLVI